MPNTTDLLITCLGDSQAIDEIIILTRIPLTKVTDSSLCGGSNFLNLESYAFCGHSLYKLDVLNLIEVFRKVNFTSPELSSLTVTCDVNDDLDGVYLIGGDNDE